MGRSGDRHEFSDTVKRTLERRVACVCSKPGCGRITVGPHTERTRATSVGNAGHITSAAPGGPRYDGSLTDAQRRSIDNGIWLCVSCHTIVDHDEAPFGADELRRWKREAEDRAREALELGRQRDHMPRVIAILHRSMELVPDGSLARSLPHLLQHVANREVVVDARDLIDESGPTDAESLRARQERGRDELWRLLEMSPGTELAYYGIAHVPLAVHMGYLLGTRCSLQYAERDRDAPTWHWLTDVDRSFPELRRGASPVALDDAEDLAVSVSVSYRVTRTQIVASLGELPLLELAVEAPGIDIVSSKAQVEAYSKVFRDLMEELTAASCIKRVHLFVAAPMTIAFALGRQIRPTVHPDVYVYNYRRAASRQYPWGFRLLDCSPSPLRADVIPKGQPA